MDLEQHDMELDLNLAYLSKYIQNSDDEQEEEEEEDDVDSRDFQEIKVKPEPEEFYSSEDEDFEDSNDASLIIDENHSSRFKTSKNEGSFDATSLEACLVSNQMYQEYLIDIINQLENALQANNERQKLLQDDLYTIANDETSIPRYSRLPKQVKFIAAPYFRDENDFFCTKNEDYEIKVANGELENYVLPPLLWYKNEKELLRKSVKTVTLKNLMTPLMERKLNLMTKRQAIKTKREKNDTEAEDEENEAENEAEQEIVAKLKEVDDEIVKIGNYSDEVLFSREINKIDIDWYHISVTIMLGKHSDVSCRLMWKYFVNPAVKQDPFTDEEEDNLRELVEKYQGHDWDSIARDLNTGRNSISCFIHFHRKIQVDNLHNNPYSKEEDEKLLSLVKKYTVQGEILWSEICHHFPNRHAIKLRRHYRDINISQICNGKFNIAEDLLLFLCSLKYGKNYQKYTNHVPNRTTHQISNRFRNSIEYREPEKFTTEDDRKLIKSAIKHGFSWREVRKEFHNRLAHQLSSRYKSILDYNPNAVERIDDPSYTWKTVPSFSNKILFQRRVFFRNYMLDRLKWMKEHTKSNKRYYGGAQSLKKYYPKCYDANDSIDIPPLSDFELDFLISEVSIMCQNHINDDKIEESGSPRKKKTRTEQEIDSKIDSLLCQSYSILNFNPERTRTVKMFGGVREAQFNATCNIIHEALGLQRVNQETEEETTYVGGRPNKNQEHLLQIATKVARETSYQLSPNETNSKYPQSVLLPMMDILESFQILVVDRARLAEMAMSMNSTKYVNAIVGKSPIVCRHCVRRPSTTQNNQGPSDQSDPGTSTNTQSDSDSEATTSECHQKCTCDDLRKMREAYNVLRRRFVSIFFWPGVLSIVPPPDGDIASAEEMKEIVKRLHKDTEVLRTNTGKVVRKVSRGSKKRTDRQRLALLLQCRKTYQAQRDGDNPVQTNVVNEPAEPEVVDKPPPKKRNRYKPPPDLEVRRSSRARK